MRWVKKILPTLKGISIFLIAYDYQKLKDGLLQKIVQTQIGWVLVKIRALGTC